MAINNVRKVCATTTECDSYYINRLFTTGIQMSTSWGCAFHTRHLNFSVKNSVRGEIFLLKNAHFGPRDILLDVLDLFYQDLHNFHSNFRVLKSSKQDENVMSFTRLYVEPKRPWRTKQVKGG